MPDYYALLGISTAADRAAIQRAYRAQARRYHPDRGGSHETMVQLNEAYFVLSDPQRRAEYDRWRTEQDAQTTSGGWDQSSSAQEAKAEAQDYPDEWDAFERWLNRLAADFANARYGRRYGLLHDFEVPVVEGSFSGRLFVILGGVIGAVAMLGICGGGLYLTGEWLWSLSLPGSLKAYLLGRLGLFLVLALAAAGACAGCQLHQSLRERMLQSRHANADRDEQVDPETHADTKAEAEDSAPCIIPCPRCAQRLRIPALDQALTVICPNCRHRFVEHPAGATAGV